MPDDRAGLDKFEAARRLNAQCRRHFQERTTLFCHSGSLRETQLAFAVRLVRQVIGAQKSVYNTFAERLVLFRISPLTPHSHAPAFKRIRFCQLGPFNSLSIHINQFTHDIMSQHNVTNAQATIADANATNDENNVLPAITVASAAQDGTARVLSRSMKHSA